MRSRSSSSPSTPSRASSAGPRSRRSRPERLATPSLRLRQAASRCSSLPSGGRDALVASSTSPPFSSARSYSYHASSSSLLTKRSSRSAVVLVQLGRREAALRVGELASVLSAEGGPGPRRAAAELLLLWVVGEPLLLGLELLDARDPSAGGRSGLDTSSTAGGEWSSKIAQTAPTHEQAAPSRKDPRSYASLRRG